MHGKGQGLPLNTIIIAIIVIVVLVVIILIFATQAGDAQQAFNIGSECRSQGGYCAARVEGQTDYQNCNMGGNPFTAASLGNDCGDGMICCR